MGKVGRPIGSKNGEHKVCVQGKVFSIRLDLDLVDYYVSQGNKNRYINNLIRKDMEGQLNNKEG